MTQETLKRGNEIQKEVFSLKQNKKLLNSLTPHILVPASNLTIACTQLEFTEEEQKGFYVYIEQVITRIQSEIQSLENEFKAL